VEQRQVDETAPKQDEASTFERMVCHFKIQPCNRSQLNDKNGKPEHDHRSCVNYHSGRDRRRRVMDEDGKVLYRAVPCPDRFDDRRACSRGEDCDMCHSTCELLYHPEFFRKRLCHQARRCPRGRNCAFAHSRQELLMPAFAEEEENAPTEDFIAHKFKTQWCPIGGPHDWENCVYAHTCRDLRRSPEIGYSSWPCPSWSDSVAKGSPEVSYGDRCPLGVACPMAHGAKEQLYHPHFYKTSPCSDPNCKRGVLCAFTHGDHEVRTKRPLEKPASAAPVEPMPQAREELLTHQPNFWKPPQYHAFEESGSMGPGRGSAKADRQGRSQKALQQNAGAGPAARRKARGRQWPEQDAWHSGEPAFCVPPPGSWEMQEQQQQSGSCSSSSGRWQRQQQQQLLGQSHQHADPLQQHQQPFAMPSQASWMVYEQDQPVEAQLLPPFMGWGPSQWQPDESAMPFAQLPFGAVGAMEGWAPVWPQADATMQFNPAMQMFQCGFTAPAHGFDTSWPEDVGLVIPVAQPKVRKKKWSKEGWRTPSSVGTPIFSDTGESAQSDGPAISEPTGSARPTEDIGGSSSSKSDPGASGCSG
jgi:hypothetical protein